MSYNVFPLAQLFVINNEITIRVSNMQFSSILMHAARVVHALASDWDAGEASNRRRKSEPTYLQAPSLQQLANARISAQCSIAQASSRSEKNIRAK